MSILTPKTLMAASLFLLTLVSGVWLSKIGRPLNTAIFTIHKLSALATIVIIAINMIRMYKGMDVQSMAALSVIIVSGLLFLALFVSGAFLSFEKPAAEAILRIHQIAPLLALASSASAVYLLVSKL